ncbi:hypothetical protein [Nitrosomonas sp.]|uniref:hypothetical protein n=1 Tax=Nitrosomonas sp. TaxID=42353 RepID=UPI0025FD9197|nr:hypothetical protein [Nitrosomonas sp.]
MPIPVGWRCHWHCHPHRNEFPLMRGTHVRPAHAKVVVMRADDQTLPGELRVGSRQNADDIA